MAAVSSEKDKLQSTVHDLQQINHDLSLEIHENKSIVSGLSREDWNGEKDQLHKEKEKLRNRLRDSERTLVMVSSYSHHVCLFAEFCNTTPYLLFEQVASQKEDLVKKNASLEKKHASLEKKLRETPPLPPKIPQADTSELTRLQLSFFKEKKEMLERQQGLEKMLQEALEGKADNKENSRKKPPTRSIKNLALDSMKSARPSSRSRPRMPLSPTGSVRSARGGFCDSPGNRSRISIDP